MTFAGRHTALCLCLQGGVGTGSAGLGSGRDQWELALGRRRWSLVLGAKPSLAVPPLVSVGLSLAAVEDLIEITPGLLSSQYVVMQLQELVPVLSEHCQISCPLWEHAQLYCGESGFIFTLTSQGISQVGGLLCVFALFAHFRRAQVSCRYPCWEGSFLLSSHAGSRLVASGCVCSAPDCRLTAVWSATV